MVQERKKYDPEFKRQAVKLMQESGKSVSELADELGVTSKMLYRWRQVLERDGEQAFPGNGRLKPDDEYVRRLERELELVRQERDILKHIMRLGLDIITLKPMIVRLTTWRPLISKMGAACIPRF